jgi:hypothetical protein
MLNNKTNALMPGKGRYSNRLWVSCDVGRSGLRLMDRAGVGRNRRVAGRAD